MPEVLHRGLWLRRTRCFFIMSDRDDGRDTHSAFLLSDVYATTVWIMAIAEHVSGEKSAPRSILFL